jgi:hypothetical protein
MMNEHCRKKNKFLKNKRNNRRSTKAQRVRLRKGGIFIFQSDEKGDTFTLK